MAVIDLFFVGSLQTFSLKKNAISAKNNQLKYACNLFLFYKVLAFASNNLKCESSFYALDYFF